MDWLSILMCVLILLARVVDVSLDTVRMLAVVQGLRGRAWLLGFFQVLIWVFAASSVLTNVREKPWYAVAYALGYATGNWVGITIEQWLGHGEQVVRVFTRRGIEVAALLRGEGRRITEFEGRGKDGAVTMLFIETRRREAKDVARRARELDAECFYTVDDIRFQSSASSAGGR